MAKDTATCSDKQFMTCDEILQIRQIWVLVEPQRFHHFTEILIRLFQRYPEVQAQFVRLTTEDWEAVRQSRVARAIGCRVCISLRAVVATLESSRLVDQALLPIKISHARRRINLEDFKKLYIVIREYFIEKLLGAVPMEAIDTFGRMLDKMLTRLQSADIPSDYLPCSSRVTNISCSCAVLKNNNTECIINNNSRDQVCGANTTSYSYEADEVTFEDGREVTTVCGMNLSEMEEADNRTNQRIHRQFWSLFTQFFRWLL